MHKIEFIFVKFLYFIFNYISFRSGKYIAKLLYIIIRYIIRYRRNVILSNLRLVYGDNLPISRNSLLKEIYKNFIFLWMEFLQISKLNSENINRHFHISGFNLVDEELKRGKGLIILSGHYGNFEWLGQMMGLMGYTLAGIAKRQSNSYVNDFIEKNRRQHGVKVIYAKDGIKQSIENLAKNEIIAIVADQDARDRGIFVNFMGIPSSTPVGPAVIHLRSGAPILFFISVRKDFGEFDVFIEKVDISSDKTQNEDPVRIITQNHSTILEKWVKKHPGQWFWMHRRWKTKPAQDGL
jgi:KDO2-lipid IV(A) lauroyltransferase